MTEIQSLPISFTESAIQELKAIRDRDAVSTDKVLRVGVKGGGCSGLSYILEFDDRGEMDQEFEVEGVPIVLDPRHALYVAGMEVDYQRGLNDRGFMFNNPNAKSSCGCGESFST
ncbi:MAG: iron-sulfur cluster assembly accessory protein [Bacteroidota bacterium]